MSGAMGSHQSARMETDVWLTPPEIVEALGPFDLDPCSPLNRPWDTAAKHYTIEDDGLSHEWEGRVWMNPPYGAQAATWLGRLAKHGDGIALVFARTETRMFFDWVWPHATALLFIEGRLHFHRPGGTRAKANSGAPSVLIAYGDAAARRLINSGIAGARVDLRRSVANSDEVRRAHRKARRVTIERRVEWEAGREYVWWTVRDHASGYLKDCRSEEEANAHAAELKEKTT